VRDQAVTPLSEAYIELLKRVVLGETAGPVTVYEPLRGVMPDGPLARRMLKRFLANEQVVMARPTTVDLSGNQDGRLSVFDLPPWPLTMIGSRRLENVGQCMRNVLEKGVPGDFIETGVWKGGTTIFMRGVLRAYGIADRRVYVADSFEGVPAPDPTRYPADKGLDFHLWSGLAVDLPAVRENFARFGLLDDQVEFVKGWFRDTLPALRGHTWAVVRLDGDLYESTMDALENLYDDLAVGGWLIVDDYEIEACRQAVTDFRAARGVTDRINAIDGYGVCWQKAGDGS
jgi:Macrocin-O-methyltransferase (TylF)